VNDCPEAKAHALAALIFFYSRKNTALEVAQVYANILLYRDFLLLRTELKTTHENAFTANQTKKWFSLSHIQTWANKPLVF